MNGRWTVYFLLGIAIIGLIVLIAWIYRKYISTEEGFQQIKTYVELDIYMASVGKTYTRLGVPVEPAGYVCTDQNYELSLDKCYPKCRNTHFSIGDTCIPTDAVGTYPRVETTVNVCPNGYEFSPVGIPNENCGGKNEPPCPPAEPVCLEMCPDTMLGRGNQCIAPEPYILPFEPYEVVYNCDPSQKVRYIRVQRYGNGITLSKVIAIDSTGENVALNKPTTATINAGRASSVVQLPYRSMVYTQSDTSTGWRSYEGEPHYWEVDLGAEYMLQSVCVLKDKTESFPPQTNVARVILYPADRGTDFSKIHSIFYLTRLPYHNFRIYDGGPSTYKIRATELVQFNHIEYGNKNPNVKQAAGSTYENLYANYTQSGIQNGLIPSIAKNAGFINGTTKTQYILLSGKDDFININGIFITLVGGESLQIQPAWVSTSGEAADSSISTNLTRYGSKKPGGTKYTLETGILMQPYIWINLGSQYSIESIRIKNISNTSVSQRLNEFTITLFDSTKTMIYIAPLNDRDEQIIQVNHGIRAESETCMSPCASGYTSVINYNSNNVPTGAVCRYKYAGTILTSYTRAIKPATSEKRCPMNGERFNDKYIRNVPGTIPECEGKELEPLVAGSDVLYYCNVPLRPIFIQIREILGPAREYCPTNFTRTRPSPYTNAHPMYAAYNTYMSYVNIPGMNGITNIGTKTVDYSFSDAERAQDNAGRTLVGITSYDPKTFSVPYNRNIKMNITKNQPINIPSVSLDFSLTDTLPFCLSNENMKYLYGAVTPAFINRGGAKVEISKKSELQGGEVPSQLYCDSTVAQLYQKIIPTIMKSGPTDTNIMGKADSKQIKNNYQSLYVVGDSYDTLTNPQIESVEEITTYTESIDDSSTYYYCAVARAPAPEDRQLLYSCDPYPGTDIGLSPTKRCVRKIPSDLESEKKGGTIDYDLNERCLYHCKHGFTPDYYNKTCTSNAPSFTRRTTSLICPIGSILDKNSGKCYNPCDGKDKAFGNLCYPESTEIYTRVGKPPIFRESSCPTGKPEQHANSLCYEQCRVGFASSGSKCINQGLNATNYLNSTIDLPAVPARANMTGLTAVKAIVYGNVNVKEGTIATEMEKNIKLGTLIQLDTPDNIENYIRVGPDLQPYIRNFDADGVCQPVVTQTLFKGEFTQSLTGNSQSSCDTPLTPDLLSLFSYSARNFIKNWVYNRTKRMIDFNYKADQNIALNRKNSLVMMQPNTYGIDIKDKTMLDKIAQAFYNQSNGTLVISYIYDIFTIGSTMLDVRIDVMEHKKPDSIQRQIEDLKAKYISLINANITQDLVDQVQSEYKDALAEFQAQQDSNVYDPLKGMNARFFYTYVNDVFIISGFSLEQKAITSFIPQRNCGLIVAVNDEPGNVNYTPNTNYTKNPIELLDCTNSDIIKRIMTDYADLMMAPGAKISYPTGTGEPVAWDMTGNLVVTSVSHYKQITPTQCAFKWKETVYDRTTNTAVPNFTNIERRAIMSYVVNTDDWYANNIMFDMSGFKFLTSDTIPKCVWQPDAYKENVGLRTVGFTEQQAFDDYFTIGVNENRSLCPTTNPGLVFDTSTYAATNNLTALTNDPGAAKQHYINIGKPSGLAVAPEYTLIQFNTPIEIVKPLPSETNLDDGGGVCPPASCQDMSVLYDIVNQYNADTDMPGIILRITRAVTPTSMECHVEADVDWSATYDISGDLVRGQEVITIDGDVGGKSRKPDTYLPDQPVRKGLAKMPKDVPNGVQKKVTFSVIIGLNREKCKYTLSKVGDPGSGTNIQVNTPSLYKPMEYTTEAQLKVTNDINPLITDISTAITNTINDTRSGGTQYRGATYGAVGDILTMKGCPIVKCSSPAVMTEFATKYKQWNDNKRKVIQRFSKSGMGEDGLTCDYMFRVKNLATGNTIDEGARVKFTAGTTPSTKCTFTATSFSEISFRYFWTDAKNMENKDLSRASEYKFSQVNFTTADGFTDYTPQRPTTAATQVETQEVLALREASFGRDYGRNIGGPGLSTMYQIPLKREGPEEKVSAPEEEGVAYKFLRFRPIATRKAAAEAVSVQRVSFFYKGVELIMSGAKVSNPMGGWEGRLEDVVGAGAKGFRDDYKKPLVFAFTKPVLVDGFSFTTSRTETPDSDPVRWKVEGSHNGTFWQVLSDQSLGNYPVPAARGTDLPVFKF